MTKKTQNNFVLVPFGILIVAVFISGYLLSKDQTFSPVASPGSYITVGLIMLLIGLLVGNSLHKRELASSKPKAQHNLDINSYLIGIIFAVLGFIFAAGIRSLF